MKCEKNVLISVIVPIYNVEEYIGKCIESILNQTYSCLEIILVDDGSKDMSGKICDEYACKDERITVLHKGNGGLVSARKAGLKIAKGDYIGFVDGDDYIDSAFYDTLLKSIISKQVDFVHTGFVKEINGKSIEIFPGEEKVLNLQTDGLQFLQSSVLDRFDIYPSIWSKLFRREFIKKCYEKVPNEQSYGEDLICLCVALLQGKKMYIEKKALYHYIVRPGSITHNRDVLQVLKIGGIYETLTEIFKDYRVYPILKDSLDAYYLRTTLLVMKNIKEIGSYVSLYYFENIEKLKGNRIILYGAGKVGQDYYAQVSRYSDCPIVGWLDVNYRSCNFEYSEVRGIDAVKELEYDVIIIAVKRYEMAMSIKNELLQHGVPDEKIFWKEPREII